MKNKKLKYGLFISFIVLATLVVGILFLNYCFRNKVLTSFVDYNNQQKKWVHKGFLKSGESYSSNRLIEILERGIEGVEIDVFYSESLDKFIVSHDFPIQDTIFLEEYLTPTANKLKYWFDLKNLKNVDVELVIKAFFNINKKFNLNNQFIIESKDASKLAMLTDEGFYTCFWIATPAKSDWFKYSYFSIKNKLSICYYDYSAISMPYYKYKSKEYNEYKHLPIQTWVDIETFNKDSLELLSDNNLKIVLIDNKD